MDCYPFFTAHPWNSSLFSTQTIVSAPSSHLLSRVLYSLDMQFPSSLSLVHLTLLNYHHMQSSGNDFGFAYQSCVKLVSCHSSCFCVAGLLNVCGLFSGSLLASPAAAIPPTQCTAPSPGKFCRHTFLGAILWKVCRRMSPLFVLYERRQPWTRASTRQSLKCNHQAIGGFTMCVLYIQVSRLSLSLNNENTGNV